MILFILAVIVLIAGIIVGIALRRSEDYSAASVPTVLGCAAFAIILTGFSVISSVPTGTTGILVTFGKVAEYNLDAGLHIKAPWQSVVTMDNRVQKATIELSCFSSDIQEVSCTYAVNYRINKETAQDIYRTIGAGYFDTVISPNVADAVKTIMAHYSAEALVGNRDKLAFEIEELLRGHLEPYNVDVVATAIEDLDFTDEFTAAVEAKQVAVQEKLRAQTEQERLTMEAQQAAERAKINAEAAAEVAEIEAKADLEVTKIQADAAEYAGQKEAAKNKAISEWLTEELIRYYYIQQWDGELPATYMGSDNVTAIMGVD